jgi:molybdopterin-binding protein
MKVSARNQLPGTVKAIKKGAVNAEIIIELAEGVEIASIITIDSLDSLGLEVGKKAYAVIKASNIMVGVEH